MEGCAMSDTIKIPLQVAIDLCKEMDGEIELSHAGWEELLRKAERERDEARHEIIGWRNKWECAVDLAAQEAVVRHLHEKTLSTIHRWIDGNHPDGFIDSLTHVQNLERVADRWHDRLEKLEREREAWRKCTERLAAIVGADETQHHFADDISPSLEEFSQLKLQ